MRFWVHTALASTALAGISTVVQAEREPIVLEPTSRWNVDFAPTKCRLARIFGEGDDLHVLIIEQHYPSASAGLSVGGPSFKRFRGGSDTMLAFSDTVEPRETEPFKGTLDTIGDALIYSNVRFAPVENNNRTDPSALDDESGTPQVSQLDTEFGDSIEYISLKQRSREVRFVTGEMGDAFAVLNRCTQDMIRDWGLDLDKHLSATRKPQWTNEDAVVRRIVDNYPEAAARRGEQAILRMRVIIDEEGKVADCVIDEATDTPLESPACRVMQNAEFEPALDANGQPFRSFYATSITYRIG